MEEKLEKTGESTPLRDELGRLLPGQTANPNGRPPDTPEDKIRKKAIKEFIAEYKADLAEALPKISPILKSKAIGGDLQAIKEVNDRVMGKAPQDLNLGNAEGLPFILTLKKDERENNQPAS